MKNVPVKVARAVGRILINGHVARIAAHAMGDCVPSNGALIDTSCATVTAKNKLRIRLGVYEYGIVRLLRKFWISGCDLVELGSSIGVVSSTTGRMLSSENRLYCVEANPRLLPCLQRNLEHNIGGGRVSVINGAIDYSTAADTVNFTVNDDSVAGSVHPGGGGYTFAAPRLTLSGILREHNIRDYMLACDIEGAEAGLLHTDSEAFARCKLLVIELHRTRWLDHDFEMNELAALITSRLGLRQLAQLTDVWAFAP